jgi:hypothetical protein
MIIIAIAEKKTMFFDTSTDHLIENVTSLVEYRNACLTGVAIWISNGAACEFFPISARSRVNFTEISIINWGQTVEQTIVDLRIILSLLRNNIMLITIPPVMFIFDGDSTGKYWIVVLMWFHASSALTRLRRPSRPLCGGKGDGYLRGCPPRENSDPFCCLTVAA